MGTDTTATWAVSKASAGAAVTASSPAPASPASPREHGGVLWGTSFDATAVSGVVTEFTKLAAVFRGHGHRVHLDLGYDIKEDKDRFFRPYTGEAALLPGWVALDRVEGAARVAGYDRDFVRRVLHDVVQGRAGDPRETLRRVGTVAAALSREIVRKWEALGVTAVIVENGTLPENLPYTRALYAAIEEYGRSRGLGRYVLWRDHDLMWSSEPGTGRYGAPPFPAAVRPVRSPFIRHVVLHERARRELLEWAPGLDEADVLPNCFPFEPATVDERNGGFRSAFGIPADAFLLARCSRVIPQKRIDRDIRLLAAVGRELADRGIARPAWLFVAGRTDESEPTHRSLVRLAEDLGVRDRVVFGGPLLPLGPSGDPLGLVDGPPAAPAGDGHAWSVRDLLAHADLASFLTSYGYDSYGNPIGEAIACRVPYIATRYQAYDAVYGDKGFRAPIMEISAADDGPPGHGFTRQVTDLLVDERERREIAAFNHALGRSYFAPGAAERLVRRACRIGTPARPTPLVRDPAGDRARDAVAPMGRQVRASVVLPVYNEAANIGGVLRSLLGQRDDRGPLDPRTYEIIIVDNNSDDGTLDTVRAFAAGQPYPAVQIAHEPEQGVACARKAGMDLAVARSHARDGRSADGHHGDGHHGDGHRGEDTAGAPFFLVSADADCVVDPRWLAELLRGMESSGAAIGVCDYYYPAGAFAHRPLLWDAIDRTLRCRHVAWRAFGGFPDGKGFAVTRDAYEDAGGIELSYQLKDGRFRGHLSDDWDFGIRVRALGHDIVYVPGSRVEINPRRVDHALDEVITGKAYGSGGIITMRDIRAPDRDADREHDLTPAQARQAWEFSIKDFTPKNIVLPLLLTPSLAERRPVQELLTAGLARRLAARAEQMRAEMSLTDFLPIHSYKTPCYRLYLEFADEIFARLRTTVGPDIGRPPPLPDCFADVPADRFTEFVRYFCEDRESGEAHDYFGNGGVF